MLEIRAQASDILRAMDARDGIPEPTGREILQIDALDPRRPFDLPVGEEQICAHAGISAPSAPAGVSGADFS